MNEKQFRFQDMEIWKRAAEFSPQLFRLADELDARHLFRFAEQLRQPSRNGIREWCWCRHFKPKIGLITAGVVDV